MANSFVRYTGDGSTVTYAIPFSYLNENHIQVTVDGVVNTFTLDAAGTSLTLDTAPANGTAIQISRASSQNTRLTDYASGSVLTETDLDTDSLQDFYMSQEALDRAGDTIGIDQADFKFDANNTVIKNVADPVDLQDAVTKNYLENTWLSTADKANINTLAGINADVTTVAGIEADVTNVSSNSADITTVANDIANVNTTALNIADITTVANDLNEPVSEIETVAGSIANVDIVGNDITNVNAVAANETNINAVQANEANINAVQANEANINSAVNNETNINAAVANETNINSVVTNETNINAVAGNETNINAVQANEANINSAVANETNINSVATNETNINAVAGNETNINAAVSNETNINAVVANETDISSVAANEADIDTVAANISDLQNIALDLTNVNIVATDIANVNTVATDIADVNTVAGSILDINRYAEEYKISATEPSTPSEGDLWYDETDNELKYYTGTEWLTTKSYLDAVKVTYKYVGTAGQTVFTGNDANGTSLSYNLGLANVYLNGTLLDKSDYTETDVNTITLTAGVTAGDELVIDAFNALNLADIEVSTVYANITKIQNVEAALTAINTVDTNIADINTVASIAADITTVAGDSTDLQAVAADIAAVRTAADDLNEATSEIDTVANAIANVDTVGTNISDVNTIASNLSDIQAVNSNQTNINSAVSNETNINTVATNISNVNAVGNDIANINAYFDQYQVSATAPSTPANGDLWFDTTNSIMKVYSTGSGWQAAGSSVNGTSARFTYTATAGQTTFTGSDDNGETLAYDAGYIDAYLNGVKLVNGSDITVSSGTSVVLASGTTAGDTLELIAYGTFELSNIAASDITSGTFTSARFGDATIANSKLVNDSITINGTSVALGASVNVGTSWTSASSSFTAAVANAYFVDTSGGVITVTLPASPSMGDEVRFVDATGSFDTNNLTVSGNGENIQGVASDLTVDTERAGFALVYYNATQGWLLKDK